METCGEEKAVVFNNFGKLRKNISTFFVEMEMCISEAIPQ